MAARRTRGAGRKTPSKAHAKKTISETVWRDSRWKVLHGELKRSAGRPRKAQPLFKAIGEKLPYRALYRVREHLRSISVGSNGIYVAHDSMGAARYVGRGNIFNRLSAHRKAHELELKYFSFYIVLESTHEREIETLLIRAGGAQLHFNERKKRVDIQAGNIRDYEAGTLFYERQYRGGRRKAARRRRGRA